VVNKALIRFILLLIIEVCTVVLALDGINLYVLPHNTYIGAYDWFLFEGVLCIITGVIFALGSGGIGPGSLREARLRATVDAVYGTDYPVSQVFRKDKWKPKGFPKAALVLLIAGIIALLIYVLSL
jgi:hypothetical protein